MTGHKMPFTVPLQRHMAMQGQTWGVGHHEILECTHANLLCRQKLTQAGAFTPLIKPYTAD